MLSLLWKTYFFSCYFTYRHKITHTQYTHTPFVSTSSSASDVSPGIYFLLSHILKVPLLLSYNNTASFSCPLKFLQILYTITFQENDTQKKKEKYFLISFSFYFHPFLSFSFVRITNIYVVGWYIGTGIYLCVWCDNSIYDITVTHNRLP